MVFTYVFTFKLKRSLLNKNKTNEQLDRWMLGLSVELILIF